MTTISRRLIRKAMSVSGGIEPGCRFASLRLVRGDLGLACQGERHFVQAREERLAPDAVDVERDPPSARRHDLALLEVDAEARLAVAAGTRSSLEFARDRQHVGAVELDRQHAVLE